MTKPQFGERLASYREMKDALTAAQRRFEEVERTGASLDDVREQLAAALQNYGRTLGYLASTVRLHRPHILTLDNMRGDEAYRSPIADRLALDLAADGDTHPLVKAGVASDGSALAATVTAVSIAAGRVGSKLAWDRLPPGGGAVLTEIWLDTAKSPMELATEALAPAHAVKG